MVILVLVEEVVTMEEVHQVEDLRRSVVVEVTLCDPDDDV